MALAGAAFVIGHAAWMETTFSLGGWRPAVRDLPAAAGFALVIAAVAAGRGPVLRGLAWRPLAGAGIVSYGLYLWHLPVLLAVREAGLLPEPFVPRLRGRADAVVPRGVAQLATRRAPGDRVVAPARAAPRAAGARPAPAAASARLRP